MDPQIPMIPDYKIIKADNLETLENLTDALMKDNWQIAGVIGYAENRYFREMVKLVPDQAAIDRANQERENHEKRFIEALDAMDQRVKDLLEINNIQLIMIEGAYYTNINGKTIEGISARDILDALKKSKHYPVDMADETVLNAIEGVV